MRKRITRYFLGFSMVGAIAAVGFFFKSRFLSRTLEKRTSDEVLFHVNTSEKVIALTIDDGPHESITAEILDTLAAFRVKATFFVIGNRIAGNEDQLKRMVAEGHELGNHLMYDKRSIDLSSEEFAAQLKQVDRLLRPYGRIHWFRPGSGWYNQEMLEQIRPYGYRCVVGSLYPYDAQVSSVEFVSNYILGNAQPGSIIILHDGEEDRRKTVTVLQRILPPLLLRGYRFVTLSELVLIGSNGEVQGEGAPLPDTGGGGRDGAL